MGDIAKQIQGCTVQTCPIENAYVEYQPTLAGNITYLAIFGVLIVAQLARGIYYRTWTFLGPMVCGIILEILGYVGRVQLHSNPFTFNAFLLYLICLTLGPAFLNASIYLCLGRLVIIYGEHMSRFKAKTYSIVFISSDIVSLVLQAVGGALTSTATTQTASNVGVDIMIAGLAFQVFSLVVFMLLCIDFASKVKRAGPLAREMKYAELRQTRPFRLFLWGRSTPHFP